MIPCPGTVGFMSEILERWRRHSPMTDPGSETFRFDGLPSEIGALCRIIQGVLIHTDWIAAYGLGEAHAALSSRETLPLCLRLLQLAEADSRALSVQRPARTRAVGTCRDYALMMCGMLRHQGIPARVRCGFATYFIKNRWEDHWICEYWRAAEGRWCRVDAQLDEVLKQRLEIRFDATDLPPALFMMAGDSWRLCRAAQSDPIVFGHGTAHGLWFIRVNVIRDHYALNEAEVSEWDSWRHTTVPQQLVTEADQKATDLIALRPEAPRVDVTPPWLT
jgi:hypothetical protein